MKSSTRIVRRAALAGVLAVALAVPAAAQIKIALDSPPDPQRSGTFVFANALTEHLKAAGLNVRQLPVGSIGGEAERLDQTSQGLLEVNMADLGRAGQLEKLIFGFTAPYLFDSMAHLDKAVANSDLLERVNASTTKKGIRVVALVPVGGFTGIFNTRKAITKPEDMADLRFRALDENQIKLFQAWGTNAVVITMPEVANALQTGIAHGYINPPFVPFLFGHTAIIKHYTDAGIAVPLRVAMVSEDWYKKLSDKDRAAFREGIVKAIDANRAWVANSDKTAIEQLEKAGITVTKLTAEGRKSFQDRSKPAYTALLSAAEIQLFIDAAAKNR